MIEPALHGPIAPYRHGMLAAGDGHEVYWEVCGNPQGLPALFVHGGPGGGCSAADRRLFDPRQYFIILFDQRGCGRSRPLGELRANTTAHLLADMEALRVLLGVERWLLLGGSWGAALALAYAQRHRERVAGLILRGIFTASAAEIQWLYGGGAGRLFPRAWQRFCAGACAGTTARGAIDPRVADRAGADAPDDLIVAYHARLHCGDAGAERRAAQTWCAWEEAAMEGEDTVEGSSASSPDTSEKRDTSGTPVSPFADAQQLARARIETHYLMHGCFLQEGELIANATRLHDIDGCLIQGMQDHVTPPATAVALQQAWPQAALHLVAMAGHGSGEPGIRRGLLHATHRFAAMQASLPA